jgi:hypothetical protein
VRVGFGAVTAALCACGGNGDPPGEPATVADASDGAAVEVPVVERLTAVLGADGAVGITFQGRPGPIPVHWGHIELLDQAGQVLSQAEFRLPWFSPPNRFFDVAFAAFIEQSATAFSGSATYVDAAAAAPPTRVRVAFENREEQLGDAFESDVSTLEPQGIDAGDACDPFGVLSTCPESSLCDVRDPGAADVPTCQERPTTCPLELPTLDGVYEGSNAGSSDNTQASCTLSRGNVGSEQGHVFVAPASGPYRFVAESVDSNAALTLFVRRYCEYARLGDSELACSHATETEDARPTVELELTEGQTVYVFVEAWWANGGNYRLSVEAR